MENWRMELTTGGQTLREVKIQIQGRLTLATTICYSNKVSKVGDCCQGWPEDSLFNSYYTEV